MRILLLPCHSILEYDEFKMFRKMGHEVKSIGSYINPDKPLDDARPPIDVVNTLYDIRQLIAWAEVVVSQHRIDLLQEHSDRLQDKKVIYRSLGQCSFSTEDQLRIVKERIPHLKIVRYSHREDLIYSLLHNNVADDVIYFYKDYSEFGMWNRKYAFPINICQSVEARQRYCGLHHMLKINNLRVYSSSIDNRLSYAAMLKLLTEAGCYFYAGTFPAQYTLSFMEAALIGVPIVSINKKLAGPQFEVDEFIENGVNGFASGDYKELNYQIEQILNRFPYASNISENIREFAYNKFCSDDILNRWEKCLTS